MYLPELSRVKTLIGLSSPPTSQREVAPELRVRAGPLAKVGICIAWGPPDTSNSCRNASMMLVTSASNRSRCETAPVEPNPAERRALLSPSPPAPMDCQMSSGAVLADAPALVMAAPVGQPYGPSRANFPMDDAFGKYRSSDRIAHSVAECGKRLGVQFAEELADATEGGAGCTGWWRCVRGDWAWGCDDTESSTSRSRPARALGCCNVGAVAAPRKPGDLGNAANGAVVAMASCGCC
mmetsp:Transcript_19495/g.56687  ORF Transcript_19495/g.56687 Transcript_19495/m.56687 type:complete len:238 (-) Transcript_19495:55-768(-)